MILTFDIKAWNVIKANRFGLFSRLMALRKSASVTGNNKMENVVWSIGQPSDLFGFFMLICPLNPCFPDMSGTQAYKTFYYFLCILYLR
jgi:hypothetical protein